MTLPIDYESSGRLPKELEPRPKVLVRFHGYMHDDLNLQAISDIKIVLGDHLKSVIGKSIVYTESSRMDHSTAATFKKIIANKGFVRTQATGILLSQLGRQPSEGEIEDRIRAIASSDLDTIASKNLIPGGEIHNYFLFQVFEDLKQQHEFEFDLESHSNPVTQAIGVLAQEVATLEIGAFRSFKAGNFSDTIESYRRSYQKRHESTSLREREIVEHLRDRTRPLVRGAGGSLFVLHGAAHLPMADLLRHKIGGHTPVRIVSNEPSSLLSLPTIAISGYLRRKEQPPDEMVAQEFFQRFLLVQIQNHVIDTHQLTEYASNYYGLVIETLSKVVLSSPSAEIKRFCEEKMDGLEFLRTHPQAESLWPLITASS